ncbi:transporter substrate-binding domain-containing protein [Undibacterium sp. RTI2.1]|uniref:substrate-binding periplasmic protein n=2 Tax=Undibacterium TaxID=401469 RepID=UPI002B231CFB|nr:MULTISPECIES: transporter substrate-binding domain-containing protein [unclassified Undibacterium]MEB0032309.1 transporter substrate-binding domain-containing protein [Undibacterium sp. RTI2.1]MEB0118453.1 transporter substrate-binding domain-containing protein [Undibacterium sp. RTI2.2]
MSLFKNTTCRISVWQLRVFKFIVSVLFIAPVTPVQSVELTIYTENWPPISFKNGDKVDGMAVEVVDALQKKMGTNSAIQLVPWARGYKAVLEDPNVLLFTVGRSAEREKQMTLLGPVAISKTVLYTRKGNAKRLLSLGDKIYDAPVGAYRDSIFADAAVKKGFHTLDLAATPQITAKMLMMNRFDLWSEGSVVVPSVLKEIGYSGDDVEPVMILDSLELFLAFSAKIPLATIKLWEGAMRQIKKDGTFQKIHQKWLPNEQPPMEVYRIGLTLLTRKQK